MYENYHFLRENIVDINAAVVGISRIRWTGIDQPNEKEAKRIMKEKRFDILPINSGSSIKSYFHTIARNNYGKIGKAEINHRDVISLQTHIRDVVKNFYIEKRYFFFLLDENKISGLISESNLNSRLVKVWLFSLLSELEVKLGELIIENMDEEKLKQKVFARNDKNSQDSKRRFEKDSEKGLEPNFVEYLYLSTLTDLIAQENLFLKFGYANKGKFENEYKKIKDLRNKIAHSSSIITEQHSVRELWNVIDKIEESLFYLR